MELPESGQILDDPPRRTTGLKQLSLLPLLAGWLVASACGTAPPPDASPAAAPTEREGGDSAVVSGARLPEPGARTRGPEMRQGIDVESYDLFLDLSAIRAEHLEGRATLRVRLTDRTNLHLDFAGLQVDSVRWDGAAAGWGRDGSLLAVHPPRAAGADAPAKRAAVPAEAGSLHRIEIFYHGRPAEGLAFVRLDSATVTTFGDNWPNRARWWFPANDHPSDKATVRYEVVAPEGLEVLANGRLVGRDGTRWTWETRAPIPVYTMVVAVAPFSSHPVGRAACGAAPAAPGRCVEVVARALPGDSAYAAERFRRADDMVEWMTRTIAPFPYARLDHVESGTRFGGMENASAIFYPREPWRSGRMGEGVIAHETAHQWFGDAVTPATWRHLWLSEGFASYFGPLWFEAADGREAFQERMERARREYMASDAVDRPVLGPVPRDLYALLDENAYEKGAWVLHMLRGLMGDSAFFRGIRSYYREKRHGIARTEDLRRAMEASSGDELGWFFQQWLERPGYPRVEARWWHTDAAVDSGTARETSSGAPRRLALEIRQVQPESWPTFRLPMDVEIAAETGDRMTVRVAPRQRTDTVRVRTPGTVRDVRLDPDGWILMEARARAAGEAPGDDASGRRRNEGSRDG